ncbi:MAG: amylo-alpha-1,6-glucosidase [Methanotrichaceae archaeon]
MEEIVRRITWPGACALESRQLLRREWLVTNGLGGYASGTVVGATTRRYHGLLISALPDPFGRWMMLNHLFEHLRLPDGRTMPFSGGEGEYHAVATDAARCLTEFRLEMGLPIWKYDINGYIIEKRILMPHMQNTVHINYHLLSGPAPVKLEIRPSVNFRSHDTPVSQPPSLPYELSLIGDRYEISEPENPGLRSLRMMVHGQNATFTMEGGILQEMFYRREADRGYDARGMLWSPGYFSTDLTTSRDATLVASTHSWKIIMALKPDEAFAAEIDRRARLVSRAQKEVQGGTASELVLAADQFIVNPIGRIVDLARANAAGDELRTVVAGYHWFTDWGRDTMISLEGLTITTNRYNQARWILRTFAHYIKDGLIPNRFPEGESEGVYNTADATLWFFHAIDRYVENTGDRATLRILLPRMREIIDYHLRGTRFGIGVDPKDGLLRQGEEGYALTWMDAKVRGWVVTPRRGKAVEIEALWYNALKIIEECVREEVGEDSAKPLAEHAERARQSFNKRFWYSEGGYLYDVVDGEHGDDPSCRPNQVMAISLKYPILDREYWEPVLKVVEERLLTPVGLRSLAPGSPDYKSKYFGDLRARDAAYHQGTVWAWLIGPFIDAWLKVHPEERQGARKFLLGFIPQLDQAGIGSISEVFDAEPTFTPHGCIAQAWSVAEVLRCWAKTA